MEAAAGGAVARARTALQPAEEPDEATAAAERQALGRSLADAEASAALYDGAVAKGGARWLLAGALIVAMGACFALAGYSEAW